MPSLSPLDMRTCLWRFGRRRGWPSPPSGNWPSAAALSFRPTASWARATCLGGAGLPEGADRDPLAAGRELRHRLLGMLSLDEYMSPLQMILDDEFCGTLMRMAEGFAVTGNAGHRPDQPGRPRRAISQPAAHRRAFPAGAMAAEAVDIRRSQRLAGRRGTHRVAAGGGDYRQVMEEYHGLSARTPSGRCWQ